MNCRWDLRLVDETHRHVVGSIVSTDLGNIEVDFSDEDVGAIDVGRKAFGGDGCDFDSVGGWEFFECVVVGDFDLDVDVVVGVFVVGIFEGWAKEGRLGLGWHFVFLKVESDVDFFFFFPVLREKSHLKNFEK